MPRSGNVIVHVSLGLVIMSLYSNHVFVSYIHENQKDIRKLCEDLEHHGIKAWIDRKEIKPGVRWKAAIRSAIREGDYFIACFSKEYTSKPKSYMNEELVLAIEELRLFPTNRVWFIPVMLSECHIPARDIGAGETLRDIQWVSLYEDWDFGIKQIIKIIKPIPQELQHLIHTVTSKNKAIQIQAIEALGETGSALIIPTLKKLIKSDDKSIYLCVVEALSKIGGESASIILIDELNRSEDQNIQKKIISALGKLGPPAVKYLIESLKNKNQHVSKCAQSALTRIDAESSISLIANELTNIDNSVRERAAYILAEIGNDSALPALHRALRDKNSDVRYSVAYALLKIGNESSLPVLKRSLKDKDPFVADRIGGAINRINRDKWLKI